MYYKKLIGMGVMLAITILLSACNIGATPAPTQDLNAIYTQAAELVATQFALQQTQTALAVPPTPLPSPTAQPLPTFAIGTPFTVSTPIGGTPLGLSTQPGGFFPTATIAALSTVSGPKCNDAIFTGQEYPLDGAVMKPGQDFEKWWTIKNTGTCTWDEGYEFHYLGGTLDGYSIKIQKPSDFVKPGETITFKVKLTASLQPNTYTDCWSMMDDKGYYFGQSPVACVQIVVKK